MLNLNDKKAIEKMEYENLLSLNTIFQKSLDDFNTRLDNSMKYLEYLTLPMLIASIEEKSYNPFSEIIEKYVQYIIIQKMEEIGNKFIPLGYSSDLCFETQKSIVHIDVKTANIKNSSDFDGTIPLGFNQTSYSSRMPLGIRGSGFYLKDGIEPFKVNSNLPTCYDVNGESKLTITNALLFIYPDYKDIIDSYREDLKLILNTVDSKLSKTLVELLKEDIKKIDSFLENCLENSKIKRRRILSDNIIRGIYIQKKLETITNKLGFTKEEKVNINNFFNKINDATQKLRNRDISPLAIISISIPNGELKPLYDDEIVSGKDFGKSIRYHYNEGKFKSLNTNIPRVVFLDYNPSYREELEKYFEIFIFETFIKKLDPIS